MRLASGEILTNTQLSSGTTLLRVHSPEIGRAGLPGQFLHVRCGSGSDPLLRRPVSISRVLDGSSSPEEFSLLVDVIGRGSALLAGSRVGDRLDLLGPLGRGFVLHPRSRQILLVAGGIGIAPLLALAAHALAADVAVTMLFGARTADKVFPAQLIPAQVEYVVSTDDGSQGRHGLVTAAVPEYLDWADQVFACGPLPMLRSLAQAMTLDNVRRGQATAGFAQVSLEEHMACGVGACYGCVIDTTSGRQRVCRDGPVFDIREVKW